MKKLKKIVKKPSKTYPLFALKTRNQRQPDLSLSHPILEHVILDCEVINAHPMYFYRIAFLGVGALIGNKVELKLQIDAIKRYDHENNDYREYLGEIKFNIKVNRGIQKVKLQLEGELANNLKFKLLLNSNKILKYLNGFFAAWRPQHKFYCWIIDPKHYIYYKNTHSRLILPNIIGETTTHYSQRYYLDPTEELNAMLLGNSPSSHSAISKTILSQTYFEFSNLSNCANSIISYPYSQSGFELLINKIVTSTQYSNLAWSLFQPSAIQIGGIQTFKSRLQVPLQALLSGYIEFLIRVPDQHSKEHYQILFLTEKHQHPFNCSDKEYLGICHAVQQNQAFQINQQNFHNAHYYSKQIYHAWLNGWWQHIRMPLHQLIDFHPDLSYQFFLQRIWAEGEKLNLMRAEDLIILSGHIKFTHDLAALISSHDYSHLLSGTRHDL